MLELFFFGFRRRNQPAAARPVAALEQRRGLALRAPTGRGGGGARGRPANSGKQLVEGQVAVAVAATVPNTAAAAAAAAAAPGAAAATAAAAGSAAPGSSAAAPGAAAAALGAAASPHHRYR